MKGLEDELLNAAEWRSHRRQHAASDAARKRAAAEAAEASRAAAAEAVWAAGAERRAAKAAERREAQAAAGGAAGADAAFAAEQQRQQEEEERQQAAAAQLPSGLPAVTPDELAAALRSRAVVAFDVRSAQEADWGRIKGAAHAPYVLAAGSSLAPEVRANPAFIEAARKALGPPDAARAAVLYGEPD